MQFWTGVSFILVLLRSGAGEVVGPRSNPFRTCFLDRACENNRNQIICEDLSEIPECFPENTESIIIRNSPDFTEIPKGAFDDVTDTLRELLIQKTDLKQLEDGSLRHLRVLETFEVSSSNHFLGLESAKLFTDLENLETLNFTNCANLETLSPNVFSGLFRLKHLILTKCDIQDLKSNSFAGLTNLETLDLEDNVHLESIPRNALSSMRKLKNFYFRSCDMSVLYPEYFDSSFKEGNLERVLGTQNEWDCQEICDFVNWLENNPGFKSIANLGYCASPYYITDIEILDLDHTSICSHSTSVFLTFTVTVCIMTFMLFICFCLVMKNCCFSKCKLRCWSRNHCNRRLTPQPDRTSNSHRLSTISQRTVEGDQSSDSYPEWNINDIDPPSYSSLQPKTNNDEIEYEIVLEENNSLDEIQPPSYSES